MKISKIKRLIALGLAITMIASIMPMNLFGISKVFAEGMNLTKASTENAEKINDITWTIGSDTESGVYYTLKGQDEVKYISGSGNDFSIPADVSFNNIKSVGVDLSFDVVNYDVRKVNSGDYVEFNAPEGLEFVSAPAEMKTAVGNFVVGTFSLTNSNKTLRLTFGNALDPSNYISGISGGVSLEMQVSDVSGFNEAQNVVLLDGIGANTTQISLAFPAATSDIVGVEKKGEENTDINGASWEVKVGSAAASAGASLAGITVTDTFDSDDMYVGAEDATSMSATLTATKADGTVTDIPVTFDVVTGGGVTTMSYKFPDDTVAVAPSTFKYNTNYSDNLLNEATAAKSAGQAAPDAVNNVTISGGNVIDDASNTASASTSVSVTTVQKSARQIDGSTMEWTLILNEGEHNVYAAEVKDVLMNGLTVDESYGIHITDDTTDETVSSNKSAVLTTPGTEKTIASDTVKVSYTDDADDSGKQNLKIKFTNTFQHKYTIVFRTKIAANFTGSGVAVDEEGHEVTTDGSSTNVIDNKATVSVSYPKGGGTGGTAIRFEDTTVRAVFVSAYLTVSPEGVDSKTGTLKWTATPSSKTEFDEAIITLSPSGILGDDGLGAQELYGIPEVKYLVGNELQDVPTSCYSVSDDKTVYTFDSAAMTDAEVELDKVRINYTTKALDFFKSTANISYYQQASIKVTDEVESQPMKYNYTAKKVHQSLQDKMIEKTVESVLDDVKNEAYFHFTIPINRNEVSLSNVEVTDDLTGTFYYKVNDGSEVAVDSSWYEPVAAAVPTSSNKYVTHMVVGSEKIADGIAINGNKITYSNASLNEAGVLHIYVQMTEAGKDALGLAKTEITQNNEDVKIYVNNTATIKADELLTDDKTMSATVESKFDDNSTVVEYKNVDKKGVQGTGAKAPNVTWTININAAFANEDEKQVITDTIPAGLTIDRKSIKLSYGKHGENGTGIVAGDAITGDLDATESTTNSYAYSIASHRDGTTTLKVILPKGVKDESYVLTYDTVINKSAVASYSNTLEYAVADKKCNASATIKAKKFVWGSGYPKVLFTFTKLDKLSTATNKIPVAGAHYGLYSSKDCKSTDLVTEGYTDGLGQITLVADQYDSNNNIATYYLKEMASETGAAIEGSNDISGYVVDENVYGGYTATTPGPKSIVPVIDGVATGDSYFTDVRKEDATGTANLDKLYKYDANGISVAGLQSEFNLIIYPKAELGNTTYTQKAIVKETAAGTYDFVGTGDATAADTTNVLQNTASTQADATYDGIGTIQVNKLPWGTYAFVETSAPDGFVANKTPVKFVVKSDGSVHYLDASGNEMAGVSKGELANNQTRVTLKKTDATGKVLTDYSKVSFTITGPASEAQPFVGSNDTSITIAGNAIDATTGIFGTYAGKFKTGVAYTVTESDTSVPYGYAAVKPFTFTIDKFTGDVKLSAAAPAAVAKADASDSANTLVTIKEPIVTLKVTKKDQKAANVIGAVLHIEDITTGMDDSDKGFAEVNANIPTGVKVDSIADWTSDGTNWNLTGQLIAGHTYRITETNELAGYIPVNDSTKYSVTVAVNKYGVITRTDVTGQKAMVSTLTSGVLNISNLKVLTDAKVTKISSLKDANNNDVTLAGAKFNLYQKNGANVDVATDTFIKTVTTAATGVATFTDIPVGNYYVIEENAPNNYEIDGTPVEFTVDNNSINPVDGSKRIVNISNNGSTKFADTPKKVSIAVTDKRVDDDSNVVNANIVGATYELYDVDPTTDGATPIATMTIDADTTQNVFTNLDWQKTYYIKQTSVPDGYILDTLVKTVDTFDIATADITKATSLVKTVNCVNPLTNVNFNKYDQDSNVINGVTFTITPATAADRFADGESSKTWTSAGSAYNLMGVLVTGDSYVITEDSTPAEYLDAKDSHGNRAAKTITVGADGKITVANGDDNSVNMTAKCENNEKTITGCSTAYSADVNMVNTKIYADAKLTKIDSHDSSIKLQGAEFDLYKMNGTEPNTATDTLINTSALVTDVNGEIEVEKLPLGNYYFTEEHAPASYRILAGDNIYRFDVDASVNNTVITNGLTVGNERVAGHIDISKTGMGTTVAGAEYTLYTKDSNDQYVPVKRNGKNYTLAIDEANVTKDATGKYTGTIRFEDLNWGKYYVKETKAPKGYTVDSNYHGIYEIKDGQLSQSATVADETTSIKLNVLGITAEDEDDNQTTEELDDVEILITGPLNEVDESGNSQVVDSKTFTTDSNGYVEAENEFIVGNEYTVSAVDPHDNYNVIDSFSFKVKEDGTVELIDGYVKSKVAKTGVNEITMKARKSLFFLELTDVKDKALADGKLAVYEVENGVVAANPVGDVTYTTEVNGDDAVKIRIEGLMPGDYQLKQSEAPAGYVTAQPISFTLKADNTVKITSGADKETLGTRDSINPKKVATIVMQDPKSQVSIQTLCTPYEKIQKEYGEYEEALNAVNIKIYENPNCVTGLVYDSSVMELPDTSKDLTTADSENKVTLVSEEIDDRDGRVYIQGLEVGKTYYVQIDSVDDANNVIINKTRYAVTVANDPTKTVWAKVTENGLSDYTTSSELTILNDVYRGDVVLTKTDRDDTSKTLANSVYGIYRKNDTNMSDYIGRSTPTIIKMNKFSKFTKLAAAEPETNWELVSQITTDANGQINFEGIVAGVEYQIKEIDEPEGYQVSKDPITFKLVKTTNAAGEVTGTKIQSISNGNKTAVINEDGSIIWYEPRLKVEINKLDPSGNRLAGATLQVIHKSTGKVIDEWVSEDSQGHMISGLLKGGDSYILHEVSAPEGYVCADDITFVAEAKKLGAGENYVQQVTMVDYATKEDEHAASGANGMATQQVIKIVAPKTNDTNIFCEILHLFK
ncbi:MAG: hypothetical protein IJ655_10005 [Lachnospiraceae bacterium]|nr:hypothetical protein [Lachnospiraceae bacterium]